MWGPDRRRNLGPARGKRVRRQEPLPGRSYGNAGSDDVNPGSRQPQTSGRLEKKKGGRSREQAQSKDLRRLKVSLPAVTVGTKRLLAGVARQKGKGLH